MNTIVVTLLPVGQGAMNLIEIYDEGKNLKHLTLIDCGIDRTRPANYDKLPEHTKLSVDYVVAKMKERIFQEPPVYLDYVLFTHRDSDHWTLFDTILKKISGSAIVCNGNNTARTFQRNISDTVSEDFFGVLTANHFSYTRTYSQIAGLDILEGKYHRIFQGEDIVEESLDFYNTEQNYQVSLEINFKEKKLDCEIYNQDNCPVIKAHLSVCIDDKTLTAAIYTTFTEGYPIERVTFLPCSLAEESPALWNAWKFFVAHLSQNELRDYASLIHITDIIDEGLQGGSFFYVSTYDIIDILTNTASITPIVGQFLWGGNPWVDNKNGKTTGVGNLRKQSEYLAEKVPIEVYPSYHFRLCDNISLDILERIPVQNFQNKEVEDAESTKSSAILNNGTSAVALLSVKGNNTLKFLFTGDATIHTFHSMYHSMNLIQAIGAVWTAPHHGSYTTLQGLSCINKNKPEEKEAYFPYLLSFSQPKAMVVESGLGNKHGLPNISFFRWVKGQFRLNKPPLLCTPHFLYVNSNDNKNADWNMGYTPYPIYSGVSAEKNQDNPPDPDDPKNLRNPVITYKIHRYGAAETDEQFIHVEECIARGEVFRTVGRSERRPGQPAPPPQESDEPSQEKPEFPSTHLFFHR